MKLHAFDRQTLMAHTHDLALRGACADLEHGRKTRHFGDQGMIPAGGKLLFHALEQPLAVMAYRRDFAVHQAPRAHDFAAECLHHGLMTETHAENGHASGKGLDHLHRNAGVARRARTGRYDQMRVPHRPRLLDAERVVAIDVNLRAEHQKRLHEIVGKGIVVIDQQQPRHGHDQMPSAASSSARRSTALFAMTSAYSAGAELSATMPPPA